MWAVYRGDMHKGYASDRGRRFRSLLLQNRRLFSDAFREQMLFILREETKVVMKHDAVVARAAGGLWFTACCALHFQPTDVLRRYAASILGCVVQKLVLAVKAVLQMVSCSLQEKMKIVQWTWLMEGLGSQEA